MKKETITDYVWVLIVTAILFFGLYYFDSDLDWTHAAMLTAFFVGASQILWMVLALVYWVFSRNVK